MSVESLGMLCWIEPPAAVAPARNAGDELYRTMTSITRSLGWYSYARDVGQRFCASPERNTSCSGSTNAVLTTCSHHEQDQPKHGIRRPSFHSALCKGTTRRHTSVASPTRRAEALWCERRSFALYHLHLHTNCSFPHR